MITKEEIGCSGVFSEKFIAFFKWNCLILTPKMTKIPKFSSFQRIYAVFFKIFDTFKDWNIEKDQERNNMLSSSLF